MTSDAGAAWTAGPNRFGAASDGSRRVDLEQVRSILPSLIDSLADAVLGVDRDPDRAW